MLRRRWLAKWYAALSRLRRDTETSRAGTLSRTRRLRCHAGSIALRWPAPNSIPILAVATCRCYIDRDGGAGLVLRRKLLGDTECCASALRNSAPPSPNAATGLWRRGDQLDHALQLRRMRRTGRPRRHIAAIASLHDIRHMLLICRRHRGFRRGCPAWSLGSAWFSRYFGPKSPSRCALHVAAKRYLAAVEPGYFDKLTEVRFR